MSQVTTSLPRGPKPLTQLESQGTVPLGPSRIVDGELTANSDDEERRVDGDDVERGTVTTSEVRDGFLKGGDNCGAEKRSNGSMTEEGERDRQVTTRWQDPPATTNTGGSVEFQSPSFRFSPLRSHN